MLKVWILYNLLLILAIIATTFSSARSVSQFILPLLLLPVLFYLGREVKKKPRRRALSDQAVFASSSPTTSIQAQDVSVPLEGHVLEPGISDDNRRLFLKLVGSTSLSVFFMAVLGKKSASAAFFGSMPGPGTVAIKDSSGTPIDPAEKQPTDGYTITEVDDADTTSYYGFVHKTGAWYISKETSSGSYRYAKGTSSFTTNWTGRALLTYDYFDAVF